MSDQDETDWSRCAICQEVKPSQQLQCPADTKRQSDAGAGYSTFAANILKFNEVGCLPININISRLNEGNGIESTLANNRAKWHKNCYSLFNSTKLKRAQKRHSDELEQAVGHKYTRSSCSNVPENEATCFFCDEVETHSKPLRNVCTFGLDSRVRASAFKLQDQKLMTKLSQGADLIALEAKYHPTCLTQLYKKADSLTDTGNQSEKTICPESIALAELVAYIEESSEAVFKLADLARVYLFRLQQLGPPSTARVNTTRLKERLLTYLPSLECYSKGRDVFLTFKEELSKIIQRAHTGDSDEEAMHLAKAATIVRKEMLATTNSFNGTFDANCQESSVPKSLLSLINMILYGQNIETQSSNLSITQAGLTLAQLVQYNCYIRRRGGLKQERRKKSRETPVAIYTGLAIHAKTRSREVVETMYNLGLSVSYDRILSISTSLGNAVCRRYHEQNVVCPSNLRNGLFTTAAVDNIDHNPSSTTAQDSFHGTGISMFQNMKPYKQGSAQPTILIGETASPSKTVEELPEWYTNVTPVTLPNKSPTVPERCSGVSCKGSSLVHIPIEEETWLKAVKGHIDNGNQVNQDTRISWAAYHSANQQPSSHLPAVSALLPLFPDNAKSAAMITHAMDVIKSCVQHLNRGQVPVIAMDQPLYAVAKQIQWNFKDKYGEDKFVVMFGGLHIEMAFLKLIGGWLEGSGWTAALVDANVASPGTAESFIKATSVTRSRRAHQVGHIFVCRTYAIYQL